jgi:pimeloyl-ACP methyl ester carboxylesterase
MPKIEANGVSLYYELHGPEDGDVIVLSNGIMMSTASWGFQLKALATHMRVLLYDCRGMWQSDHPEGDYSMALHADDLAALLKALNIPKAHIAGISYGSEVSLTFSLNYPEMTQSLIVMDGVSHVTPLLKSQARPWLLAAERKDPEMLFASSVFLNFSEEWIEKNQALLDQMSKNYAFINFDSFVRLMKAFEAFDVSDRLHEIKCPTLFIVGEEDPIKGRSHAEKMLKSIPHAEYLVIPGGGHAVCIDKPEPLNTALIGFVLKHSQRSKVN